MSTPTAIEIVREYRHWQLHPTLLGTLQWTEPPHPREDYDAALASVLRDAERFKALERAHNNAESNLGWARFNTCSSRWAVEGLWPLAELADKLKEDR